MKATKAAKATKKSLTNSKLHKSKAKKKVVKAKVKTVQKAVEKPIVKKATTKITKEKLVVVSQKTEVQVAKSTSQDTRVDTRNLTEGQLENYKKWLKFQKQLADKAPENYSMSADFEVKTPLQHKTHGWGVVVQKRDNYIDVLFESGLKTLIVNYKQD